MEIRIINRFDEPKVNKRRALSPDTNSIYCLIEEKKNKFLNKNGKIF
jgi:hypothetical protein